MKRIPRRVFTTEYKSEAIKLAEALGVPVGGEFVVCRNPPVPGSLASGGSQDNVR